VRTSIKSYTDKQLLERVESIAGRIPNKGKYLIIGVQSQEDEFNVFDGHGFKQVSSGTTNVGKTVLYFYTNYDLPGAAVWKTDMFYKDLFERGYHKRKMRALRQKNQYFFIEIQISII
jgi:hypothetical protein